MTQRLPLLSQFQSLPLSEFTASFQNHLQVVIPDVQSTA